MGRVLEVGMGRRFVIVSSPEKTEKFCTSSFVLEEVGYLWNDQR